jgi:branched-chain amino acid transport system substrate-binding protein
MAGLCLRVVRGLFLLLAPGLFLGCALLGGSPGEVRIGIIAMLSGENAQNGRSMVDAARLALESAGRNGTIKIGKRAYAVRYFVEDDGNTPEGAMNAARALIYKDRVAVLIGPQFSSNAIPVARLADREKVLMICPLSTNPETTAGKRYVFRIPYLDTFQGAVLARFAREVLRADRAECSSTRRERTTGRWRMCSAGASKRRGVWCAPMKPTPPTRIGTSGVSSRG